MFATKSILARLLANENVTVMQGNYQTASFNVESRVLQLPMWKEMSSDVYDLLVGHEVAHALWTPRENLAVKGVPFSFVNVVEDIRIEKMVLRKYPGLVSNFSRGYLDLVKRNIFGTEGKDLNELPFMDRLNLKAKGRQHVDISFSDEEQYYVNRAMSVETFEDVRDVVIEIAEWLKEKQREENPESNLEGSDSQEGEETEEQSESLSGFVPGEEEEDGEETQESGESSQEESESGEDSEEGESGDSVESESSSGESSEEADEEGENKPEIAPKGDESGGKTEDSPLSEVATDVAQHQNQSDLIDNETVIIQPVPRDGFESRFVKYKELLDARRQCDLTYGNVDGDYAAFLAESKPIVNMMVKEFEMRKAAYRNLRARTSNKGTLDVNNLHKYKYDDQLFKQVTTLADGKNHGMIMLIDYSGSMNSVMPAVIKQTINLVQFCKRVNIPFQVIAFTSDRFYSQSIDRSRTVFDYSNLVLVELFNSKMSKSDYDFALKSFFARACSRYNHADVESLGSTPLNAALMCLPYIFADFRKANPVHKLNLITLTDGDSDSPEVVYGQDLGERPYEAARHRDFVIDVNGQRIEFPKFTYRREDTVVKFTPRILDAVCGKDIQSVNYFIADKRQLWGLTLRDVIGRTEWTERYIIDSKLKEIRKSVKANGVFVNDNKNASGYDRQFILLQRQNRYNTDLTDGIEDLEIEAGATTAKIAKAFSKYGDSKKKSRIVTRKFAEIIA